MLCRHQYHACDVRIDLANSTEIVHGKVSLSANSRPERALAVMRSEGSSPHDSDGSGRGGMVALAASPPSTEHRWSATPPHVSLVLDALDGVHRLHHPWLTL